MKAGTGIAVAIGALLLLSMQKVHTKPAPRPNIILISIDTLRADRLGCYGYGKGTTPAIDAFRSESVLFRNVIAAAPSTLPSHASILTALPPQHHGASHTAKIPLHSRHLTLPEVLLEAGYRTAAFVGGGQLAPEFGLNQGFETYEVVDDGRLDQVLARALPFVEREESRPFFLFLHTYQVHQPYTPSIDELERFEPSTTSMLPAYVGPTLIQRINAGQLQVTEADREHVVNLYDAEVSAMDAGFSSLVAHLKHLGVYDDSIIVLTSDHGEELGEHGFIGWHSHTLYEELLRVPLIVRLPSARHGASEIGGVVRGIDVAPMILEAAGVPRATQFRHFRLYETIESGKARDVPVLIWRESPPGDTARHDGLRTSRWKLIDDRLYDLRDDPGETSNVAAAHPAEARELAGSMKALIGSRDVPDGRATTLETETIDTLRSLGYLQ